MRSDRRITFALPFASVSVSWSRAAPAATALPIKTVAVRVPGARLA
jgi:hypothetical protein